MPPVVDLFAWAATRERARIEAALAVVNAGTRKDDGRRPGHAARAERDINAKCRVWPEPRAVARLVVSHGFEAARERWGYVSNGELETLAARGGARECRP